MENDEHERLRALASVVDSAGGRGTALLRSILYGDSSKIYTVVAADGRHAALADNYRSLLDTGYQGGRAEFDAVRSTLLPLDPALIDEIAGLDVEAFDPTLIAGAATLLDNHRQYLFALDEYADRMHAEMGEDALATAHEAEASLHRMWLLLWAIGVVTAGLVVLGTLATLLPLRRLTHRAEAISAGNIVAEPLPIRGSNDIRSLTRTTNEMSVLLAEVEHEIQRLADGEFESGYEVDLPGTIGDSLQGSMNRLHDITRQLQRSEQLASAIVAGAGDAIWTVGDDGRIVSANEASARLTGIPTEAQAGRPISQLLTSTSGDARLRSVRGGQWSVLVSSSPVENGDDPIRVVIAHDISERLDFEQQLALQARRDPLTGLPNRLAVIERIRDLLASGERAAGAVRRPRRLQERQRPARARHGRRRARRGGATTQGQRQRRRPRRSAGRRRVHRHQHASARARTTSPTSAAG